VGPEARLEVGHVGNGARLRVRIEHRVEREGVAFGGTGEEVKLRADREAQVPIVAPGEVQPRRVEVRALLRKERISGVLESLNDVAPTRRYRCGERGDGARGPWAVRVGGTGGCLRRTHP